MARHAIGMWVFAATGLLGVGSAWADEPRGDDGGLEPIVIARGEEPARTAPPEDCGYECRPSDGGSIELMALGGYMRLRALTLHTAIGVTEPDPLKDKDLRLDGDGRYLGGGTRFAFEGDHLRGGFDVDVFMASGPELTHEPLTPGFRASAQHILGANILAFFGGEADYPPVHPYGEMWIAGQVIATDVLLEHDTFGALGTTHYNAYAASLGPRLGILFDLDREIFADLAVMGTFVGDAPRFGLTFGIAYFDGHRPEKRDCGVKCLDD